MSQPQVTKSRLQVLVINQRFSEQNTGELQPWSGMCPCDPSIVLALHQAHGTIATYSLFSCPSRVAINLMNFGYVEQIRQNAVPKCTGSLYT